MVFIVSDAYNAAKYSQRSHLFFLKNTRVCRIDFCSEIPLFNAGIFNTILQFEKGLASEDSDSLLVRRSGAGADDFDNSAVVRSVKQASSGEAIFRPNSEFTYSFGAGFVPLLKICYISKGLVVNADERYWKGEFETNDCLSTRRDRLHPKPFVQGKDLPKWHVTPRYFLE